MPTLKVVRVLLVEGEEEWVKQILAKSYVQPGAVTTHGERGSITEIVRATVDEGEPR